MTSARPLLDDVFRFVEGAVLPGIGAEAFARSLLWRRSAGDGFNATIRPVGRTRYRIAVDDGVADGLFAIVEAVAASEETLERTHLSEAAALLGDENTALNLSLVGGMVFVALHEACHAAAGHVDYLHRCYRSGEGLRLSYTEARSGDPVAVLPGSMDYALFRRIAELEADGAAFALTFEFADEIAAMLSEEVEGQSDLERACERAVMLGALAAVLQLETAVSADTVYPDPVMRLLNVVASAFRVFAPTAVVYREGDYVSGALDDETARALIERYVKTAMPSLFMLDGAVVRLGREAPFLAVDARSANDMISDLMQDALTLLGGGEPSRTEAGRRLTRLSGERRAFMEALKGDRRAELWRT